ncbi:MAG: DUF1392 domain-containing protein (plasmid) [Nodularia sp. CChRGM 3473]
MNCAITTLERCWYLSSPWGQHIPILEVNLLERVYLKSSKVFAYCCGVHWQYDRWIYAVVCDNEIVHATKHQIIGTGRLQATTVKKPNFVLGERVMFRSQDHATNQRLIWGIRLLNGTWFYVVELSSPTLTQTPDKVNRFSFVNEQDLVCVIS